MTWLYDSIPMLFWHCPFWQLCWFSPTLTIAAFLSVDDDDDNIKMTGAEGAVKQIFEP
jgi:hypothetical protein